MCIAQGLIGAAACMFHIKNGKVASIHHVLVADLERLLGVAFCRRLTDFDLIIIGFKIVPVVP